MADDNGVVTPMTNEEKQQSLARARALLEELADMPPYEPAAGDVHRTARNMAYEPAEDALTRWKREAEEEMPLQRSPAGARPIGGNSRHSAKVGEDPAFIAREHH